MGVGVPLEDRLLEGLGDEAVEDEAVGHGEAEHEGAAPRLELVPEGNTHVVGNEVAAGGGVRGPAVGLGEEVAVGNVEVQGHLGGACVRGEDHQG